MRFIHYERYLDIDRLQLRKLHPFERSLQREPLLLAVFQVLCIRRSQLDSKRLQVVQAQMPEQRRHFRRPKALGVVKSREIEHESCQLGK